MRYLFLLRHSPYNSSLAREALDMALAAAAFDQDVQLLFAGDGVYQLLAGQDSSLLQQKNIGKNLDALALYDINALYVAESALAKRGLDASRLVIDCQPLSDTAIHHLISQADHVMSF